VVAALLIVLLHPLTITPSRCAAHPHCNALEEALVSLWKLSVRALTTSVLMLWEYVSSDNLLEGLYPSQRHTALHWRLLVQWALLSTLAGAAITVQFMRAREALDRADEREMDGKSHDRSPVRHWQRLSDDDDDGQPSRPTSAVGVASCELCGQTGSVVGSWRALRAAAVQVLLLNEKVVAWMVGCAWTDVRHRLAGTPARGAPLPW
jgi:hypothetical protein